MKPEIRNQFEQSLLDNGYKIFKENNKNAIRGFQKKITDNLGVRYFITIYHYNHREQLQISTAPIGDSYTTESQFDFGEKTSNLSYWGNNQNINDIEDFFYKFWSSMSPDYYEKY